MLKRITEFWDFVKFCANSKRRNNAKLAELEAAKQILILERQQLLAEVFQQIPSMSPRRKPELWN